MLRNFLFDRIDNSQIVIFRIFFGLLVMADCWGAIATGWVKETFVDPEFTFTFIGFSWTQFLLGNTMYYIFGFLGLMGLFIMLGAFYRLSSFLFALGWSLVYFMQKEHYNNHYYLLMLVAWFMVFIPANRYKSVDIWIQPKLRSNFTYFWTRLIFILQLFIVYTYAAFAKFYAGWVNGDFLMLRYRPTAEWISNQVGWQPLSEFVYSRQFAQIFAWLGIGFDLLIVPLLLWKRTRVIALIAALFFHLFNSVTLHIGIFPYFALAMSVFFFPPETIRRVFFPRKSTYVAGSYEFQPRHRNQKLFTAVFFLYFAWQIWLPLRHWQIPGDVLWTEEGHRLSWRMMLRTKSAMTTFYKEDIKNGVREEVRLSEYMTPLQRRRVAAHPDMIWQFAHYLKEKEAEKGNDIKVFVKSKVSLNGGEYHEYIDENVDLSAVPWSYFGHQQWILPSPENFSRFTVTGK